MTAAIPGTTPARTPTRRSASGDVAASISLGLVIPTLNAGQGLARTLRALAVPTPGLALDVVVVDGGSQDDTLDIAQRFGARIATADGGRGPQLAEGARVALGDWLLFLHGDTQLPKAWPGLVRGFVADTPESPNASARAGYFRFALDDPDSPHARRLERLVAWRSRTLGLPYGDQGLLIARRHYEALGGYPAVPLMEDVALARKIGRGGFVALDGAAVTSAARYRRDGYWRRALRNSLCLGLYFCGIPPDFIRRLYG